MGSKPPTVIEISSGRVQGIAEAGFMHWRGIPYAAAPVGSRRFRAPIAAEPWDGVRKASTFGPGPWPTPLSHSKGRIPSEGKVSEDCLTINVTRREGDSTGRPVIVYIYGGGNRVGASSIYPGERLIGDSDVIAVTFNFRIGVFGFLDLAGLEGGDNFDSNLALRDQLAALTWIQENITAFGGDPGNVTIYGESAGALAVTTLLATPAAAGLFARAVSASSPAFHVYSRDRARNWATEYLKLLGLKGRDIFTEIERLPARELIIAALAFDKQTQRNTPGAISVSYVVDDDLLPEAPIAAFRSGRAHRVPLLIGTCRNEHALFAKMMKDELALNRTELEMLFATSGDEVLDRVLAAYTVDGRTDHARVGGDAAFWHPSTVVAEAHSQFAPTRMFRVDHGPRLFKLLGFEASHGSDVALLFGDLDRVEWLLGAKKANGAFINKLRSDLTAFASTGEPAESWPLYNSVDRQTQIYAKDTTIISDPEKNRRTAWKGFLGYP